MRCIHEISGESSLTPNYFSISTDSRTLITNAHSPISGEDRYECVYFWDLASGKLSRYFDFQHDHMSVGCYETWLLGIVDGADAISMLNLQTEEFRFLLDAAPQCIPSNIQPFAMAPYEPILVCGDFVHNPSQSARITSYNLLATPTRQEIGTLQLPVQHFCWEPDRYPTCNSSVLISPDSKVLLSQAVVTRYGSHHVWDVQTGSLIRTVEISDSGFAEYLAVNQVGQVLACGQQSETIHVWDICTEELVLVVDGNLPATMTIDGRFLAYCTDVCEITIWDIEHNQAICRLNRSAAKIERIAMSPDGKWLASLNQEQLIEIWHEDS
jgi:WD40 repeat protein